jgi:hypothetical protein
VQGEGDRAGGEREAASADGEREGESVGVQREASSVDAERGAWSVGVQREAESVGAKRAAQSVGAKRGADGLDAQLEGRRTVARPPREDASGSATVDSADAWRELAAQASYRDALVAAEEYGLPALCESLPARDLLRLADVARFARKPARAIEALRALRRRFPNTDAAAMAAFERARIAKASSAAYPDAAKWFATYLRERADGPLAREALAGLMEAQEQAGQHAAASKTATRYLERFPKGPHAEAARRLLDSEE